MLLLDSWRTPELYEWWFARTPPGRAARVRALEPSPAMAGYLRGG